MPYMSPIPHRPTGDHRAGLGVAAGCGIGNGIGSGIGKGNGIGIGIGIGRWWRRTVVAYSGQAGLLGWPVGQEKETETGKLGWAGGWR